jgi:hypothetical protein
VNRALAHARHHLSWSLLDLAFFFDPNGLRVPSTTAKTMVTMKKCLIILLCAVAGISTAEAYTVIAVYSRQGERQQFQHFQYNHHGNNVSRAAVEKLALEGVSVEGGINPKIVVSTGKPGYFAIAVSQEQDRRIVAWSGPQSSAEAATSEAIAHCKQYGGTNPRIKTHWADGMSGQKK